MSHRMKLGTATLICGVALLVVGGFYTPVRRLPNDVSAEPFRGPQPAIDKPAVAKVLRTASAPSVVALSPPPGKESSADKTRRLLALVNSRETAIDYLQSMVDQNPVAIMRAEEIPRIEILAVNELSAEEQANMRERQKYSKGPLVIARVDGAVHFLEMSDPIPVEIIPRQVRAYLTDDDIRDFQTKVEVSSLEHSFARTKSRRARAP